LQLVSIADMELLGIVGIDVFAGACD